MLHWTVVLTLLLMTAVAPGGEPTRAEQERALDRIQRANQLAQSDRPEEALAILRPLHATWKGRSDDLEARILVNMCATLQGMGDLTSAGAVGREALEATRRARAPQGTAIVLQNLGEIFREQGRYDEADAVLHQAITIKSKLGDPRSLALAYGARGAVAMERGRYAQALSWYSRSLDLSTRAEDGLQSAGTMADIGAVYWFNGDYDKARSQMRRGLAAQEKLGDVVAAANTLGNLAGVMLDDGDGKEAIALLLAAIERHRELHNERGVVLASNNLGIAYRRTGQPKKALEVFHQLLRRAAPRGDVVTVLSCYLNIAAVRLESNALEEAAAAAEHAATLATRTRAEIALLKSRHLQAAIALARGRHKRALSLAREAALELRLVVGGLSDTVGAQARHMWAALFDTGIQAAVALGDAEAALWFMEAGRASMLLESFGRNQMQAALARHLRASLEKAREQLEVARGRVRRSAARDGGDYEEQLAALKAAQRDVEAVLDRIRREGKAEAALIAPTPPSLAGVRAMLAAGDVFVEFALLEENALALVVTPEEARIVSLAPRAELEKAWEATHNAIFDGSDWNAPVRRLRALVFDPLALPPDTRRIIVSPDAILAFLAFGLVAPDVDVARVPSAAAYGLMRKERTKRGTGVLAIGDPAYRNRARRLPATRAECRAVGDRLLLGERATVEEFRKALPARERWRAIHFACHGRFDRDRPLLSSLELVGAGLSARDVLELKIHADLASLSACQTGQGLYYRAEGVLGLPYAFLAAGCPRVLASLWRVDDEAASIFMQRFYELWRDGEVSAATALRRARNAMKSEEKWSHPKHWACWVLTGLP